MNDGKLGALAIGTATPQGGLPELPTVGEFVLGYEASVWMKRRSGISSTSNVCKSSATLRRCFRGAKKGI